MSRKPLMDPDNPNEFQRNSQAGRMFVGLLALAVIVSALTWLSRPSEGLGPIGPAPEIIAAGWVNGEAPTRASLEGKVVLVCVWATWCGPCRREAPHLVELHKQFADRGVVFIGLTNDGQDKLEEVQRFVDTYGITWPNGWGADATTNALEAEYIPALYVIGRDGQLWWSNKMGGDLEQVLERLLAQSPVRS